VPGVASEWAREILRRSLPTVEAGDDDEAGDDALRILVGQAGPRLVWEVSRARSDATWHAFVDAETGTLVGPPIDVNRYVTGTGRIFRDNAVVATRTPTLSDQADAASAVPAGAYSTVALQGLTGSGRLDGQFASSSGSRRRVTSATNTFSYNRSVNGFSETMGYYWIDFAQRYIQSLGFTNIVNRPQVFAVDRITDDNSFYAPATRQITFGTGGVDDAEDAEVILHEYGHAIQDSQRPGFGGGQEAGAMGEGFGDYWAASVTAQVSGGYLDTCIAEWDAVAWTSTVPHCMRRIDGSKHYPESLAGEVHDDGEIWSAALWQIRGALGATTSDRVILQHHFLLPANATFNQAANALVTSAIGLRLSPGAVSSIRTILRSRGFTVTV
jgi:Zn-dependent metalloprotease